MSEQLIELMLQLKKASPVEAKAILNSQPQIAYALISLMVSMNAINLPVFQKTLSDYAQSQAQAPAASAALQAYSYAPPPPPPPPSAYPTSTPTPVPTINPAILAAIPDDQKAMVMQVLSMTPEQINMMPAQDRANILQLRATLGL